MSLNSDFSGLLSALNVADVRYLAVGGYAPNRIDLLTDVTGLSFREAWSRRCEARYGDQRMWVLGLEDLVRNKKATDRPQDRLDVAMLERHGRPH